MKLSEDLENWRVERPDEWKMDEFIRKTKELEKQNEETIYLLIRYLDSDYDNGIDELTRENEKLLQRIKQKPIEEILKEV